MIRIRVRDTAGNVFAQTDVADNDDAFALVAEWVLDGFRVEVVPFVPYLDERIGPYRRMWTTSDAGAWGDARPRNLDCNYRRAY